MNTARIKQVPAVKGWPKFIVVPLENRDEFYDEDWADTIKKVPHVYLPFETFGTAQAYVKLRGW